MAETGLRRGRRGRFLLAALLASAMGAGCSGLASRAVAPMGDPEPAAAARPVERTTRPRRIGVPVLMNVPVFGYLFGVVVEEDDGALDEDALEDPIRN